MVPLVARETGSVRSSHPFGGVDAGPCAAPRCQGSHEELIAAPKPFLERLAAFLGLAPEPDWIDACAGVVFESPRRSRDRVEWPEAVRREVATRAADHVQLAGYSFDD